ncbi:hypothetical protein FRC16_004045 [Serendipita sp. 398]|nr:hypothetical protein FRC16_004045 [Serendipita sp. 398]
MSVDSSNLIKSLYALSKRSPKLVKGSEYIAPADDQYKVTSWKMNEFKYYQVPSPFPTLARGLFSTKTSDNAEETDVEYRIVARGYDKFFNIGETPWTKWESIERYTKPPYTMTLKSNGCIIFIAALSPDKLLITSKHSLGPVQGAEESHAQVGERWLNWHLKDSGKTREQLAARLWEKNWTAVAELCDDSFEEHVLPIIVNMTGLHLHGINENKGAFNTQPQPVVDAFAEEWGFIKTASFVLNTVREVREFAEEAGKTGTWNGEAVEGFVVRTTVAPDDDRRDDRRDAPPYPTGSSFFFKIKFDEPYLMYRDWRELTKALLAAKAKGNMADAKINKAKLRRKETVMYKQWVEREIKRNPQMFATYTKNRGIIAVRDKFFRWLASPEGADAEKVVSVDIPRPIEKGGKVVLIPVAVPGCGKTTISIALKHLFGFGHTQSDNIQAKKPAAIFQKSIVGLLKAHDVVVADRNNHLTEHRTGIRGAVSFLDPPPRLIALSWPVKNLPPATVHRIASDRIASRGDNHQTLVPNEEAEHETVIWKFLNDFEELQEDEVDEVIEMEVEEDMENALGRAVNGIVELLGLEAPSDEKMGEALRVAREYQPDTKKQLRQTEKKENKKGESQEVGPSKKKKKTVQPRYYALLPEIDLREFMGNVLNSDVMMPDSASDLWDHLKGQSRLPSVPHITIVHLKTREGENDAWSACETLIQGPQPLFEFKIGHIVWNDRVMALTVERLSFVVESGGEGPAHTFLQALSPQIQNRLHITVGTKDPSIPPVEAKDMVEEWRAGREGMQSVAVGDVSVRGRVKGMVA